jgi:hypothetical protein
MERKSSENYEHANSCTDNHATGYTQEGVLVHVLKHYRNSEISSMMKISGRGGGGVREQKLQLSLVLMYTVMNSAVYKASQQKTLQCTEELIFIYNSIHINHNEKVFHIHTYKTYR